VLCACRLDGGLLTLSLRGQIPFLGGFQMFNTNAKFTGRMRAT
jgi:hypothetical protein